MWKQLQRNLPALAAIYLPAILLAVVAAAQNEVPLSFITRDPAETFETKSYVGLLSTLGIAIWAATAAVAFLRGAQLFPVDRPRAFLFLGGAALSLILMMDDLLLIHERLGPERLGIPQPVIIGLYGLLALGYLFVFHRALMELDFLLLAIALFCFAGSVVSDFLGDWDEAWKSHLAEDGLKFIGLAGWLGFFVVSALRDAVPKGR